MSKYFEVLSKTGKIIRTSESYWKKIVAFKHPVMKGKKRFVKKAIEEPDAIKQSEKDENVFLYYRKFIRRYVCVVVRHENGGGFIISIFPVDVVKKGKIVYEKSKNIS